MVTPGVLVESVAMMLVAGAQPAFCTLTSNMLHSLASIWPLPLPPETVAGVGLFSGKIILATPLRQVLKVAIPPSVIVTIEEADRSEEHTSELQSHSDLVCRLLLEKK